MDVYHGRTSSGRTPTKNREGVLPLGTRHVIGGGKHLTAMIGYIRLLLNSYAPDVNLAQLPCKGSGIISIFS